MSSLFGAKTDGYRRLDRSLESPDRQRDSDDPMLIDIEVAEDQATFDFRLNGDAVPMPGGSPTMLTEPGSTSAMLDLQSETRNGLEPNNESFHNDSIHELRPFRHTVQKQFSITDHQVNVETEENLKCIVSSLLFIAIVVVLIVVAFVFNPPI